MAAFSVAKRAYRFTPRRRAALKKAQAASAAARKRKKPIKGTGPVSRLRRHTRKVNSAVQADRKRRGVKNSVKKDVAIGGAKLGARVGARAAAKQIHPVAGLAYSIGEAAWDTRQWQKKYGKKAKKPVSKAKKTASKAKSGKKRLTKSQTQQRKRMRRDLAISGGILAVGTAATLAANKGFTGHYLPRKGKAKVSYREARSAVKLDNSLSNLQSGVTNLERQVGRAERAAGITNPSTVGRGNIDRELAALRIDSAVRRGEYRGSDNWARGLDPFGRKLDPSIPSSRNPYTNGAWDDAVRRGAPRSALHRLQQQAVRPGARAGITNPTPVPTSIDEVRRRLKDPNYVWRI